MYQYEDIFQRFDPWKEIWVTDNIPSEIHKIAARARRILKNRNIQNCRHAIESLIWMISTDTLLSIPDSLRGADAAEVGEESEYEWRARNGLPSIHYPSDRNKYIGKNAPIEASIPSIVEDSRRALESFSIEDQTQFPNALEQEYFAVLALAIVGHVVVNDDAESTGVMPDNYAEHLDKPYSELIVAMDAICHAEKLDEIKKTKSKMAKQSRKVSSARVCK